MIQAYKTAVADSSGKTNALKRSVMILPGISKAFLTYDQAKAFLDEPMDSNEKLLRIVFKVYVDQEGDTLPMDAKKFLEEGDEVASAKHTPDALFQRLMVQVQKCTITDAQGADLDSGEILKKLEQAGSL